MELFHNENCNPILPNGYIEFIKQINLKPLSEYIGSNDDKLLFIHKKSNGNLILITWEQFIENLLLFLFAEANTKENNVRAQNKITQDNSAFVLIILLYLFV